MRFMGMMRPGTYCLLPLLLAMTLHLRAQDPIRELTIVPADSRSGNPGQPALSSGTPFIIGEIYITGNYKTKSYIIERELSFHKGDSVYLPDLVKAFIQAREQLVNTRLFTEVVVYLKGFRGYITDIEIDVRERWYLFPVPYVKPVDRNISAWAEKNYSLSRLDYGLKFTHYNFTGRNDPLRVWLITGYSRQVELAYDQPYADKTLKHGFGAGLSYTANKEIDVLTSGNRQQFINSDTLPFSGKYLGEQLSFSLRYYYRPGLRTRHFFRLSFTKARVDSIVVALNNNYFNNGRHDVFYPELSYTLRYNTTDYVSYPLKGVLLEATALHRGINNDMNLWQFGIRSTEAFPLAKKLYYVNQNMAVLKLPLDQPFYNQQLLGYGDVYMRGLEKYVIDGAAGVLIRNTLSYKLFDFSIPFLRRVPTMDRIPLRIYPKIFFDYGYVYNKSYTQNSLVNHMLYTTGVGVDIVSFYDLVFKFEYSFNQLGQNGLFLHIRNDF